VRPRTLVTLISLTALASAMLAGAPPAQAAYAGRNGRIAFTANLDGAWQLYTMRPSGSGLRKLTDFPDNQDNYGLLPDWSPDGTRIAFMFPGKDTGDLEIWVVNADGTGLTQLTDDAGVDEQAPNCSPDGSQIAFARTGIYGNNTIWVMNANGSGMTQLTNDLYDSFGPEFTPDGRHILYFSQKGDLVSAIWIMNADGSGKKRLTPAKLEAGAQDVSPDGSHVVFIDNENTPNPSSIFIMNIDGSGIHRLTRPPAGHRDSIPKYSPDGTRIVFQSNRPFQECLDCTAIFELKADGPGIVQVTTDLTGGGGPDDDNCVVPDWGPRQSG
jgi:TolB protein